MGLGIELSGSWPGMCETLSSIPSTAKKKKKKG
jgi:hypothetical protein